MRIRERISTAIVVLLMTLVVWVVADRNVLRTSPDLTVAIEVGSPDPLYRLKIVEPEGADPQMLVRFSGPGRAIDSITARHRESPLKYRHTVRQQQLTGDSGEIILPARMGFEYLAEEESVSLEQARTPGRQQPIENIIVHYEREEKLVDIPVELAAEDRRLLAENVTIAPPAVSAVTLVSQRRLLQQGPPLVAIPQLDLRDLPPGRSVTRTVPLRSNQPDDIDIKFTPDRVAITMELKHNEAKRTLEGINVMIEGPPDVLNRYAVELTERRVSLLKIKGPATEVNELRPQDVSAVLVLYERDTPGTMTPRQLEIRFPPGSNIQLDDQSPPMANFTLQQRAAAPPPD